eukprot:GABV01006753.1.p1 GENE.GABV01006753.1~~GABV01006753.1.p1  ORF type:complete len:112 (-),score=17.23 GABV01006753.1:3-338(-)
MNQMIFTMKNSTLKTKHGMIRSENGREMPTMRKMRLEHARCRVLGVFSLVCVEAEQVDDHQWAARQAVNVTVDTSRQVRPTDEDSEDINEYHPVLCSCCSAEIGVRETLDA